MTLEGDFGCCGVERGLIQGATEIAYRPIEELV